MELLLGCGHARKKLASLPNEEREWKELVTLDCNPECHPDILCDLSPPYGDGRWHPSEFSSCAESVIIENPNALGLWEKYNFVSDTFDEVHAYEVLEHLGKQGDLTTFFSTFYNIWHILKPGGCLFATCPSRNSPWLWGDPGHTRVIQKESLVFLNQSEYERQLGKTAMSDYRSMWRGDFEIMHTSDDAVFHRFILQAVKPARINNG